MKNINENNEVNKNEITEKETNQSLMNMILQKVNFGERKPRKGVLTSDLNKSTYTWLNKDYPKGTKLTEFMGNTYGCIGTGVAVVFNGDKSGAYYEVPREAVRWYKPRTKA